MKKPSILSIFVEPVIAEPKIYKPGLAAFFVIPPLFTAFMLGLLTEFRLSSVGMILLMGFCLFVAIFAIHAIGFYRGRTAGQKPFLDLSEELRIPIDKLKKLSE